MMAHAKRAHTSDLTLLSVPALKFTADYRIYQCIITALESTKTEEFQARNGLCSACISDILWTRCLGPDVSDMEIREHFCPLGTNGLRGSAVSRVAALESATSCRYLTLLH